jgi:hypothetical protein
VFLDPLRTLLSSGTIGLGCLERYYLPARSDVDACETSNFYV